MKIAEKLNPVTATKLMRQKPFDLTEEIPELQKDLKQLIVSWCHSFYIDHDQ